MDEVWGFVVAYGMADDFVTHVATGDEEMERAFVKARETFRYFWREVSWEYRRIIPGLDLFAVKAPFCDGKMEDGDGVEQMWMTHIDFDGRVVKGTLMNAPNHLTSVSEGDEVEVPLEEISDWMYAMHGRVYGAYTVNLIRSRMDAGELRGHDQAWGMDFGDPNTIEVYPGNRAYDRKPGFFGKLLGKKEEATMDLDWEVDHPAALAMEEGFREALAEEPERVNERMDDGWTLLQLQALAGSRSCVAVLLELGADPSVRTEDGWTAADLARGMGWVEVERILVAAGG